MRQNRRQRKEPILLLIDGECYLCHAITQFVVKRDHARRFRFASLQSKLGQQLLRIGGLSPDDMDSFVMVQDGHYYIKSDAALRVYRELGGLWALLYGGVIFPVAFRNRVYDLIARQRYQWFGKAETCLLPTAELRGRFVEQMEEVSGYDEQKQADLR